MTNLSKTIEEQKERAREKLKPSVTNNEWARKNKAIVSQVQKLFDALWVEQQKDVDEATEQTSHAILKAVVEVLEEKKPIQGHSKECLGEYCDEAYCDIDERRVTAKTLSDIQTIINDVIEGK